MSDDELGPQLQMIWPKHLLSRPPSVQCPAGYSLRTYAPGDESRWFQIMELSGWPGWTGKELRPWMSRLLPDCWFMIVFDESNEIVASAMGLHEHTELHPFGSQLGWVASDPAHAGRKLGMTVSAAVTRRLLDIGYKDIHLGTEDFRLPAIKTYLKLGYIPFIYATGMDKRWADICGKLGWPFTPEIWPS